MGVNMVGHKWDIKHRCTKGALAEEVDDEMRSMVIATPAAHTGQPIRDRAGAPTRSPPTCRRSKSIATSQSLAWR